MKSRVGTLWLVFAALCILLPHAPLAAIRKQSPAAAIGTSNISVIAWCNKQAGTIEAATFTSTWTSSTTTISTGFRNAFNPLVAVDNLTGNSAVVWIETDPVTQKYAVYGTFYTNYLNSFPLYTGPFHWVLPATQLSASGRDIVPEDLIIAINTSHLGSADVGVVVTWSEYVSGDHVISAILGVVKGGILATPPSWSTSHEGP